MKERVLGLALVLPIVVAGGAVWEWSTNRRGTRAGTMLSEREVRLSFADAAGGSVRGFVQWTEPPATLGPWLTRAQIAGLGFDVSVAPTLVGPGERHYRHQMARRAFVAFELNGPAFERIAALRSREGEAVDLGPGGGVVVQGGSSVSPEQSRLVPVDASLDAAVLVARYPDTRTHLITAALLRVGRYVGGGQAPHVGVRVDRIMSNPIHVPRALSTRLSIANQSPIERRAVEARDVEIELRYGASWYPWVERLERGVDGR